MSIVLYMAPGTCARVTAIALEEIGVAFEARVVRFMRGEHKSDAFRRLNPAGKVPALVVDGEALTETVAIITYLAERFAAAAIMPAADGALARTRQLADLCFCASTLHPLVTRLRLPGFFAGPPNARAVFDAASAAMDEYFGLVERRLAGQPWWFGQDWSAMDGYLYWCWWRVEGAGYDVSRFPAFQAHARKMEARPAVQRALERERAAEAQLKAEGLAFTPPPLPGAPTRPPS